MRSRGTRSGDCSGKCGRFGGASGAVAVLDRILWWVVLLSIQTALGKEAGEHSIVQVVMHYRIRISQEQNGTEHKTLYLHDHLGIHPG